jgi:hypothetical protein
LGQYSAAAAAAVTLPLARPEGLALDVARNTVFVADTGNAVVRAVDRTTGVMRVLAGNPGSSTLPSATPASATTVALLRPSGLAHDPTANELFVSDVNRQQVLRVQLQPDPDLLSVLIDAPTFARPTSLAFHDFANGPRLLFVLDRGALGTGPGAVARPTVRVVDVDTRAQAILDPGFNYRLLYDLALRVLPDQSVELFVVADVGENFEELTNAAAPDLNTDPRFRFETDLYDGLDGDGDTLIDSLDPDSREPLKQQVLRFAIPATGLAVVNNVALPRTPTRLLRLQKKVPIEIVYDVACGGSAPGTSTAIDFPGYIAQTIAVDGQGRIYLGNAIDGRVRVVELNNSNAVVATSIVAGTDTALASPIDGNDPRLTRLNRPLDLLVDALDNLHLVDAQSNRVRRTWLGDILRAR